MYSTLLSTFLVFLSVSNVSSETFNFTADESILLIRGRNAGNDAKYEFVAEGKDRIQCLALDANGKPIAAETSYANMGSLRFADMSIEKITQVICKRLD